MKPQDLAINGGSPTVKSDRPMKWIEYRRGIVRSLDVLRMWEATLRGKTSIAASSGIAAKFERAFCKMTGAKLALAMNSGTATLHSAYFAVGVGPGTEVIVPSYTWHATAAPVLQCGAVPVWCEIDPKTLTLDPDDLARKITKRTRAVCVLHAWGNPAPMDRICEVTNAHGIDVIEDCSHAHGASYKGRAVGTWGTVGCFSLQGSKCVDGGEAGVAIMNDATLYDRMLLLGHNYLIGNRGQKANTFPDFGDTSLGVKYRPHMAAMYFAHSSLMRLERRNVRARRAWQILCEELADAPGIRAIATLPEAVRGGFYAYVFDYTGGERGGLGTEEFVKAVRAEGCPLDVDQFRHSLLHKQKLFTELDRRKLGGGCYDPTRPWEENVAKVSLPVTERTTERLVRFPRQFHGVPESYVRACAKAVKKVLEATVPGAARIEGGAPEPDTRVAASGGR